MLKIEAPCKINVHLKVRGRRSDGYHNLESIFLALAFGDILLFDLSGDDGICSIQADGSALQDSRVFPAGAEALPAEKNTVYQAVSLFRDRTGFDRGLRIHLEKRIPLGAGLGGGSSDAASTLRALNVLAGTNLSFRILREMAEILGSDVPFFLFGGAAFISGRGERILPLKVPEGLSVVLVYPGFPSNTIEAFRLLDEARGVYNIEEELKISGIGPAEGLIHALGENPATWPYYNDFLPVFLAAGDQEPATSYRGIIRDLAGLDADFSGLSGSGSTCFGIFTEKRTAENAITALTRQGNFAQLTFPLAHFPSEVLE